MAVRKREEISKEYKWDLTHMFKSLDDWQQAYDELSEEIKLITGYEGKLSDKKTALKCLNNLGDLNIKLTQVYSYALRYFHLNAKDSKGQMLQQKADQLSNQLAQFSSFITPELTELSKEQLNEYSNNSDFSAFTVMFGDILRKKDHVLSKEMELLMAESLDMVGTYETSFSMFNNADIKFGTVKDDDGNDFELSHGGYGYLLGSSNQEVRENAFLAYYKPYRENINTIAAIFSGSVKGDWFYAKARKYSSSLEMALSNENVPTVVYDNLLAAINDNLPVVHEYIRVRKELLGIELHMYDMYNPIIEGTEVKLNFDDSYELVKKGVAPLGEAYIELLNKARKENWLDVYETPAKRSGAYSSGVFGVHPYVLLNYQETLDSIFTTAHEMGHAMHSYKSNNAQVYQKARYKIFLAEIASTVNEVLLLKYMLANEKDINMRKTLLTHYLDTFRSTMFRQTMFAEFESITHNMVETNVPLTADALNEVYYDLNKKYYGDDVIHDEDIKYEWARIPHFYSAFYVYKYATGLISAVAIASKILAEGQPMVDKYMQFLSAGGSDDPLNILQLADIDLTTSDVFNYAMNEFKETLEELKRLSNID